MSLKLKVLDAKKDTHQLDNSRFLDVHFNIVEVDEEGNEKVVAERRLGFPIDAPKEVVEKALADYLLVFKSDLDLSAANADFEAKEKSADEVIAGLADKEIG